MDAMSKLSALVLAVSLMALAGCTTAEELRQRDEAACISYYSYWMHGYYWPYYGPYGRHW
jgi:hypothetical protein